MAKKVDAHLYKNKRPNSLASRRNRTRLIIGLAILIASAILLFCLSWFLSQPFIVINSVTVSGNFLTDTDEISATVKNILADSYLGLFAKGNILIYPEKAIREKLAAAFPAIKNVRGHLTNWQTLSLSVEERTPLALWCPTIEAIDCFYLDNNGLIFSAAAVFSESIFIKFADGGIGTSSSPIGKNFLTPEKFRSINFFLDALTPLGLTPMIFETGAETYQISLKNGSKLIINTTDDLSVVLENLEAILRSENLRKALARGGAIDYIDLRYDHKVFYKFKN